MPNKFSHSVVLARYSSLGLIDLPNDQHVRYLSPSPPRSTTSSSPPSVRPGSSRKSFSTNASSFKLASPVETTPRFPDVDRPDSGYSGTKIRGSPEENMRSNTSMPKSRLVLNLDRKDTMSSTKSATSLPSTATSVRDFARRGSESSKDYNSAFCSINCFQAPLNHSNSTLLGPNRPVSSLMNTSDVTGVKKDTRPRAYIVEPYPTILCETSPEIDPYAPDRPNPRHSTRADDMARSSEPINSSRMVDSDPEIIQLPSDRPDHVHRSSSTLTQIYDPVPTVPDFAGFSNPSSPEPVPDLDPPVRNSIDSLSSLSSLSSLGTMNMTQRAPPPTRITTATRIGPDPPSVGQPARETRLSPNTSTVSSTFWDSLTSGAVIPRDRRQTSSLLSPTTRAHDIETASTTTESGASFPPDIPTVRRTTTPTPRVLGGRSTPSLLLKSNNAKNANVTTLESAAEEARKRIRQEAILRGEMETQMALQEWQMQQVEKGKGRRKKLLEGMKGRLRGKSVGARGI